LSTGRPDCYQDRSLEHKHNSGLKYQDQSSANISDEVTLKYYSERLLSILASATLIPWTTMAADGLQRRAEATDAMKSWLDLGT
jgi:hypothetical protein